MEQAPWDTAATATATDETAPWDTPTKTAEVAPWAQEQPPAPESSIASLGREVATHIVPGAIGLVGGLLGGVGGAAVGSYVPVAGTAIGAVGGAVAGATLAEAAGTKAQRWILEGVMGKDWLARQDAQEAANATAHPGWAGAGTLIGEAPMMASGGVAGKVVRSAVAASKAGKVALAVAPQARTLAQRTLLRVPEAAIGGAASFGGMSGGTAASAAAAGKPGASWGDVPGEVVKGMVEGGVMGFIPYATSFLGKFVAKPVADAGALALSGNLYNHVVRGEPFDPWKTATEAGESIPAFLLMNAAAAMLHGRIKPEARPAAGVAAAAESTAFEVATPEGLMELARKYNEIRADKRLTPEAREFVDNQIAVAKTLLGERLDGTTRPNQGYVSEQRPPKASLLEGQQEALRNAEDEAVTRTAPEVAPEEVPPWAPESTVAPVAEPGKGAAQPITPAPAAEAVGTAPTIPPVTPPVGANPVTASAGQGVLSTGARVKVGDSPQPHRIVSELPPNPVTDQPGERYFTVKNEKTGETQTVEAKDLTSMKEPTAKGKAAEKAAASLPAFKVKTVATINDLPPDVLEGLSRDRRSEDIKGTRAVFDPATGDIYVIEGNTALADIPKVVAHEAVGHGGLRAVLGDRLPRVLDGVYKGRELDVTINQIAKTYGLDMTTEGGRREAAEELIAKIAEDRNARPSAWGKLVANIREAFRAMGIDVHWSSNDILALVERARQRATRPAGAVTQDGTLRRSIATDGIDPATLSPEALAAQQNLSKQAEAAKAKLRDGMTWDKVRDMFGSMIVDDNAPVFRRLTDAAKRAGEAAQKAVASYIESFHAIRGASGRGAKRIETLADDVHKIISTPADKMLLDNVRQAQRTIEIERLHSDKVAGANAAKEAAKASGSWTPELERAYKKEIQDIKSPLTVAQSQAYLNEVRTKDPVRWAKVEQVNAMLRAEYFKDVDMKLAAGIIDKPYADYLKTHEFYQPRVFIDHLDPVVGKRGGKFSIHDSGTETLTHGSEGDMLNDSMYLVGRDIQHTEGMVARNASNKELYGLVRDGQGDAIGAKLAAPHSEPAAGMQRITYREDGKNVSFDMPAKLAQYLAISDPALTAATARIFRTLSGVSLVKALATTANPSFAVPNFFRDNALTYLATNNYSSFIPFAVMQQARQFIRMMNPVARKLVLDQYIKHGGSTEFLSSSTLLSDIHHYGAITDGKRAMNAIARAMGWIGTKSEEQTRLMLTVQALEKAGTTIHTATPEQWRTAVHEGSNYIDFRQSGQFTKVLDQFIPYVNPGVQGVRSVLRAFKERPAETTFKVGQIVMLGTFAAWWNRKNNEQAWESTSTNERDTKAVFTLPINPKDADGNTRHAYVGVPLDQGWRPFYVIGEMIAEKLAGKEVDPTRLSRVFYANYMPGDINNLPPTVAALLTYTQNHDFWNNQAVWRGVQNIDPAMERKISTPKIATGIADVTGLSPERMTAAVKKMLPNNFFLDIAAHGLDASLRKKDEQLDQSTYATLARAPGISRFIRMTPVRELSHDDRLAARRLQVPVTDRATSSVLDEIKNKERVVNTDRQRNNLAIDQLLLDIRRGTADSTGFGNLLRSEKRTPDEGKRMRLRYNEKLLNQRKAKADAMQGGG